MKKVIILRKPFQFDPEQKTKGGNQSHEKETKQIHGSAANLLNIRIGNLDWCKCRHCKSDATEIHCLYCREVDAMLLALAKIPEYERIISPSSFHGQLPDY